MAWRLAGQGMCRRGSHLREGDPRDGEAVMLDDQTVIRRLEFVHGFRNRSCFVARSWLFQGNGLDCRCRWRNRLKPPTEVEVFARFHLCEAWQRGRGWSMR